MTKDITASTVWADSAYRSKTNEEWLQNNGLKSDIHQRKPKGKPMPETMSRTNGRRSRIRSAVEHVFARQKEKMKLFIRIIGIGRAKVKIGMANISHNMLRYVFHEGKPAPQGAAMPQSIAQHSTPKATTDSRSPSQRRKSG